MAKLNPVEQISAELLIYGGVLVSCAGKVCTNNPQEAIDEAQEALLEMTLAIARYQEAMQYH